MKLLCCDVSLASVSADSIGIMKGDDARDIQRVVLYRFSRLFVPGNLPSQKSNAPGF